MTEWFLHIGHGKTGSSYLQRSLVLSVDRLAQHGIAYPRRRGDEKGGNGPDLFAHPLPKVDADRVLFCAEHMWRSMNTCADLEAKLASLGRPKVLLVIRDPVDHVISIWQQNVKMGRRTGNDLEAEFDFYNVVPRIRKLIPRIDASGAELTILNYNLIKKDLLGAVGGWLGGVELAPVATRVNRALTASELRLVGQLNSHNIASKRIARRFVEEIHDIRSPLPAPALEVQHRMLDRIADDMAFISERAGAHGYSAATIDPQPAGAFELLPEHVDILIENLTMLPANNVAFVTDSVRRAVRRFI